MCSSAARRARLRGKLARDEDGSSAVARFCALVCQCPPLFPRLFPPYRCSAAGDVYNNDSVNYLSSRALNSRTSGRSSLRRIQIPTNRYSYSPTSLQGSFIYINSSLICYSFLIATESSDVRSSIALTGSSPSCVVIN